MRIGILADIHAHLDYLTKAIVRLRREKVDLFVVLGDVIFDSRNVDETVALLTDCDAVGVWGNHELGLCVDPEYDVCVDYSEPVMAFFSKLKPRWECGEFLFSHTYPDLDASDPLAYYLGREPHQEGALDECFSRFPHRAMIVGHFHRWFAATMTGPVTWNGDEPIELDRDNRYFFVIDAVMNGRTAVLDDVRNILIPIRL